MSEDFKTFKRRMTVTETDKKSRQVARVRTRSDQYESDETVLAIRLS